MSILNTFVGNLTKRVSNSRKVSRDALNHIKGKYATLRRSCLNIDVDYVENNLRYLESCESLSRVSYEVLEEEYHDMVLRSKLLSCENF